MRYFFDSAAFPSFFSTAAPGAECEDRLQRQIRIVSEVAGEVVGAELVLGIVPLVQQIVGPELQGLPVAPRKIEIAAEFDQRAGEQQHVAALLDRHLVVVRALAAAVDLAVASG